MGTKRGNSDEQTKNAKSVGQRQKTKRDTKTKKKPDAAAKKDAAKTAKKSRAKKDAANRSGSSLNKVKDYHYWEKEENLELIKQWAMNGLSMQQIAENMGINRATLYRWAKISCNICDSLRESRLKADTHVENALYKKATGFIKEVIKPMKIRKAEYDPETGKKICDYDEIVYVKDQVYVQPDITAIKYYLGNKQPAVWKDKVEHVIDTEAEIGGVIELPLVLERTDEPTKKNSMETAAEAD